VVRFTIGSRREVPGKKPVIREHNNNNNNNIIIIIIIYFSVRRQQPIAVTDTIQKQVENEQIQGK
jgi:hypothetical protein